MHTTVPVYNVRIRISCNGHILIKALHYAFVSCMTAWDLVLRLSYLWYTQKVQFSLFYRIAIRKFFFQDAITSDVFTFLLSFSTACWTWFNFQNCHPGLQIPSLRSLAVYADPYLQLHTAACCYNTVYAVKILTMHPFTNQLNNTVHHQCCFWCSCICYGRNLLMKYIYVHTPCTIGSFSQKLKSYVFNKV